MISKVCLLVLLLGLASASPPNCPNPFAVASFPSVGVCLLQPNTVWGGTLSTLDLSGTTVDCQGQVGILVGSYPGITIRNGGFRNCRGNSTFGGALTYNPSSVGPLTLEQLDFADCVSSGGGAIVHTNSQLRVTDCTFTNCRATSGPGGAVLTVVPNGGAAHSIFNRTTFTQCSATGGSGGALNGEGLVIDNCDFTSTSSTLNGGAIFAAFITITNSRFQYSSVSSATNSGGFIAGTCPAGTCQWRIDSSSFSYGSAPAGGAIFTPNNANLTIKASTFRHNRATGNAGGGSLNLGFHAYVSCSTFENSSTTLTTGGGGVVSFNGNTPRGTFFGVNFIGCTTGGQGYISFSGSGSQAIQVDRWYDSGGGGPGAFQPPPSGTFSQAFFDQPRSCDGFVCNSGLGGADCFSSQCVDGVCCNGPCFGACTSCANPGMEGICSQLPDGSTDPSCPTNYLCSGGQCLPGQGEDCTALPCYPTSLRCSQGVCCDQVCTGNCQSCNNAGSVGQCTFAPDGTDPNFQCQPDAACFTADSGCALRPGPCPSGFGHACSSNAPVCTASGCCQAACVGTCLACNNTASPGTCRAQIGTDFFGHCPAGQVCTGGTPPCLNGPGTGCTTNSQCQSGFCVDNFCCDSACPNTCEACNLPGLVGKCSPVPPGQDDPNGRCSGGTVCSGNSAAPCRARQTGDRCQTSSQCPTLNCVDGYCCLDQCVGTCVVCNGSTPGYCSDVPYGQDPRGACGGMGCNGAGACLTQVGATNTFPPPPGPPGPTSATTVSFPSPPPPGVTATSPVVGLSSSGSSSPNSNPTSNSNSNSNLNSNGNSITNTPPSSTQATGVSPIPNPTDATTTPNSNSNSNSNGDGASFEEARGGNVGAIAGGAAGGIVLLALLILLIVLLALRSKRRKKDGSDEELAVNVSASASASDDSIPSPPARAPAGGAAAAAAATKKANDDEYIASKNITNVEPMNAGGAFGSIFTAEYLGSEVALKKMSDASPETEKALKKELAAHKKLQKSCPNIAKVYDLWRAPDGDKYAGELFMVMELFHEGSLLDNFDTVRATPQSMARILHSCSKGLMQIHNVDVLHRDIAARNYLVKTQKVRGGEKMEAFLADFGLAGKAHKEVEKKPWRTTAPESQGLDPTWSPKSDVWSFGLLIYEVASGGKPFAQLTKCPKNFPSMQQELLKYNERPPGVSDALWALFEQCVSFDPDDRPVMAEVEQQLRVIAQDNVTSVNLLSDEYN